MIHLFDNITKQTVDNRLSVNEKIFSLQENMIPSTNYLFVILLNCKETSSISS